MPAHVPMDDLLSRRFLLVIFFFGKYPRAKVGAPEPAASQLLVDLLSTIDHINGTMLSLPAPEAQKLLPYLGRRKFDTGFTTGR